MATESGYPNQKKYGEARHKTIQGMGSSKFGVNTAQMYLFDVSASPIAIVNSDLDDIDKRIILMEIPSHSARVGDVVRVQPPAALSSWEYDVVGIVDADILWVYDTASEQPGDNIPQVGDDVKICRWVTAKADSEGALTTSSGPVQFTRNGATQTVIQDTVTPANNRPLPSGLFFWKDGVAIPVTKDTITAANTAGIPVEIVSASGTEINITAGDLNVQLSDAGVNFDATRIGDGSGVYLAINADGSINVVSDAATMAELQEIVTELETLNLVDFATEAKQDSQITELQSINTELDTQTTALGDINTELNTQTTELQSINSELDAQTLELQEVVTELETLNLVDFATEAKQDAQITELQEIEADVEAMSAKLPATLGQKASAASLATVLSTEQEAILQAIVTALQAGPAVPAALTVKQAPISFGTAAVRLTSDGLAPSATRRKLQFIIEPPAGDVNYWIGSSSVDGTTARGPRVYPGTLYTFDNDAGDYYIVSDTAAQTVMVMEQE